MEPNEAGTTKVPVARVETAIKSPVNVPTLEGVASQSNNKRDSHPGIVDNSPESVEFVETSHESSDNEPTCWGVAVEALKFKSKRNLPRPFIDAITLELNPDEFSAATLDQYLQEILELLASHDACELRAVWLEDLGSRELGQRILVVSGPPSALNYLRELCWVAYGELWFAFERFGEAALEALNSMICDPEALRLAHRAYLDGPEVLTDWIDRHQLAISRWLGQEIKTGRLRRSFGPQIAGKHVAAWRRVPPVAPGADDTQNETLSSYRMEFEFNDDLNEARRILAERWMIPDCLIVDACVN